MNSPIRIELRYAAQNYDDWATLPTAATVHIAVMTEPFLSAIFAGTKTIESRFSRHRIAPYQKVTAGDVILLKAGPIVGYFTADWVLYYDLTITPLTHIINTYGHEIGGDANFWIQKADSRYVTLIGVKSIRRLTPTTVTKTDRRGWITLSADEPTRN